MKKKMLMIATVPSMIGQFNMSNLKLLQEMGYQVDVACNWRDRSVWTEEKIEGLRMELQERKIGCIQIDFSRSPIQFLAHKKSYQQIKRLLKDNEYQFMHCHTPIAAAVSRLAAHKSRKLRIIYTAHGFHFFKGAPIINWLIYYPIEKYLSRYTDILVTINHEDYCRAQSKFGCGQVEYIPGVGLNTNEFTLNSISREEKCRELGIETDSFIILSVGEINDNKNHQVIIRALKQLNNSNLVYIIAGKGEKREQLEQLCKRLNLEKQVFFLGYRKDVQELYQCADVFAFPSKREGLGLASLEAMAFGLPLLTSNIHGIKDYSVNGKSGYSFAPKDDAGFAKGIKELYENPQRREKMGIYNCESVKKYDIAKVEKIMKTIYERAGAKDSL